MSFMMTVVVHGEHSIGLAPISAPIAETAGKHVDCCGCVSLAKRSGKQHGCSSALGVVAKFDVYTVTVVPLEYSNTHVNCQ